MTKSQVKNNGVYLSHLDIQKRELITLKGITTSQVQQALKGSKTHGQYPYPARVFLKTDENSLDIPIIFRIKCPNWLKTKWAKPKIKRGSYLTLRGIFEKSLKSARLSFTAYSYQILEEDYLAKKEILNQAKNQLPEFEQVLTNIQQVRQQLETYE